MNWKSVKIRKRSHLPLVGEFVDSVLSDIASNQKEDGLAQLQNSWLEIVGERISRVSRPVKFSDGILTLRISSSAWRQELHSQTLVIIGEINQKLPNVKVKNIIFR